MNSDIVPQLTIPPYGAEVFTDFPRDKRFLVLCYRHDGAARLRVLTWIGGVVDDLTRAGIHVEGACEITLTADQSRTEPITAKTKWRCHLKVPARLPAGAGEAAFLEAIRAHHVKPKAA